MSQVNDDKAFSILSFSQSTIIPKGKEPSPCHYILLLTLFFKNSCHEKLHLAQSSEKWFETTLFSVLKKTTLFSGKTRNRVDVSNDRHEIIKEKLLRELDKPWGISHSDRPCIAGR